MRPVWVEIALPRLVANYARMRVAAGVDVLAVVKADAYGHGAVECAAALAKAGAKWLGVTSVEEGVLVRTALAETQTNILVMSGAWRDEEATLLEHALTPVVWERYQLDALEAEAVKRGLSARSVPVHLEIDTGMSRVGVAPDVRLAEMLARFTEESPLRLDGVMTHFAASEIVNSTQNAIQIERFAVALWQVQAAGLQPQWVHAGATSFVDAGTMLPALRALAESANARPMCRAGIGLYGYGLPLEGAAPQVRASLEPVMAWKTRIVSLKEAGAGEKVGYNGTFVATKPTRLALLPLGYADGLRRELSNTGTMLVRGVRVPVVGRISMDLTVIDVTGVADAAIGDEVTVLGQDGAERITADDHARLAETIAYDITCGVSARVPRFYE